MRDLKAEKISESKRVREKVRDIRPENKRVRQKENKRKKREKVRDIREERKRVRKRKENREIEKFR